MAHDDDASKTGEGQAPFALAQNPAPNPVSGQAYLTDKAALVQQIMATFRAVLPSNYVAQTNGPWYSLQFQAMAEQLAEIQITTTEVYKDSGFDFTRTDFLWQVLGSLVFPGATDQSGIPQIDGDTAYREFLHKMVLLLLDGATKASMESGLEALDPNVVATITERYLSHPRVIQTGPSPSKTSSSWTSSSTGSRLTRSCSSGTRRSCWRLSSLPMFSTATRTCSRMRSTRSPRTTVD